MPSLLMFFGGFFCLLVLQRQKSNALPWYHIPGLYCLKRIDYIVLPFAYWIGKTTLDPTSGVYTEYNKPSFSVEAILAGYKTLPAVLFDPLIFFRSYTPGTQVVLVVGSLLLWSLLALGKCERRGLSPLGKACHPVKGPVGLFLFGVMLLVLATAPYIAVKKYFSPSGVLSSYTPLIPIPLALIALALWSGWRGLLPRLAWVIWPALALCLVLCVATWWHNYLSLEAVKVRNDSIMLHVRDNPAARECTVLCAQNHFRIPRTMDDIHTWMWTYVECDVDGEPRSIAFNGLPTGPSIPEEEVRQYIHQTTIPYALTSVDPCGKQGVLVIREGPGFRSVSSASLHYLYFRYFDPDGMRPFLESVTQLEFRPAPWRQPIELNEKAFMFINAQRMSS
jgi:hypothetical protein